MTTVLSSGRRLLELIDDLIDISRIEGNRLELDTQPLDLGPLLSGVVEELRALAGAKGIGLTFTPAADSMTVVADRVRLHEVFLNLVSNAVKFTQPGGTVRVVAGIEAPAAGASSPMVRIDVIDTGIGVPRRSASGSSRSSTGSQDRSTRARGWASRSRGSSSSATAGRSPLESTVGLGSRFSVLFPVAAPPAS